MRILLIMFIFSGQMFATEFTKKLESEVLIMKDQKLEKAKVDFSSKELFAVYYSHTDCGICVAYTKMLNKWFENDAAKKPKVQIIFATRGMKRGQSSLSILRSRK